MIANPPDPDSRPGFRAETDVAVQGPIARSATDLDIALDVLAGPDPVEAVGWRLELPPPRRSSLADYRVAAWLDDVECPTEPDVLGVLASTVAALRAAGASVDDSARPAFSLAAAFRDYERLLFAAECHGMPLAQARGARFLAPLGTLVPGDSQVARVAKGATMRHADWILANEARQEYRREWARFFEDYDALLCPVTPCIAPPHTQRFGSLIVLRRLSGARGPRSYMDQLVWAGLVGMAYLPATVAPAGLTSGGLPVGVQIVGPYLEDRTTIDFARRLADVTGGFISPPGY